MDPRQLESALLAHPTVEDCAVLERTALTGTRELVAYVVTAGLLAPEALRSHLAVPCAFVRVASIPLTAEGEVDRSALDALPVVDQPTLLGWEREVQEIPGVLEAALIVEESREPEPALHLSDLLPGFAEARIGPPESGMPAPAKPALAGSTPAIASGPPLDSIPPVPPTLAEVLLRAASLHPGHGITYLDDDGSESFQSYPELMRDAERVLGGLLGAGVRPGELVLFQLGRQRDFLTAFWACVLGGIVPVPLAAPPGYGEGPQTEALRRAWQSLQRPRIVAREDAGAELRALAQRWQSAPLRVLTMDALLAAPAAEPRHRSGADDLALIMLTSGSTGVPKGVALRHRNLVSESAGYVWLNRFTEREVTLNWMPLDHVGGLLLCHLRDVFLGCRQIHCATDYVLADPLRWIDLLARHRCSVSFAPNFAYALINDRADEIARRRWDLSAMRAFINGGEAIVARTARRFLALLEPHRLSSRAMVPAWGMSETSSGITYSDRFAPETSSDADAFVEVGPPIPGVSLRIVDPRGALLAEGVVGRLEVSGATVTGGYHENPEATAEAFTADGWFRTGDLAVLRDGRLTIAGREKDVIIVNGVNHHSHELESLVEEIDGIVPSWTAACAVREPGADTDGLALFFRARSSEPRELKELLDTIRQRVARKTGQAPGYLLPVDPADIPKTGLGKIQRARLSRRFRDGDFRSVLKQVDRLTANLRTVPDWFYRKTWKRRAARFPDRSPDPGLTAIFLDRTGLGLALGAALSVAGRRWIGVEAGAGFAAPAPGRYRIDPAQPSHYQRLAGEIRASGRSISGTVHLWTCEPAGAGHGIPAAELDAGVWSVLSWIQALADATDSPAAHRMLIVSSQVQQLAPDDTIVCERSPLLGLAKSVSGELDWLECRHIDLAPADPANLDHLIRESESSSPDREVAYRAGARWVSRLAKVPVTREATRPVPLRRGGMYVVSGGLGGIGAEVCRYLLQDFRARVLVLGRTSLATLESEAVPAEAAGIAERRAAYRMLQQAGGVFRYAAADVRDHGGVRRAVDRASAEWGSPVHGVFHLAGGYHDRPLLAETRGDAAELLDTRLGGALALAGCLDDAADRLFVGFSSVESFFGGAGQGAYTAASCLLDATARQLRDTRPWATYVIGWSAWAGLGLSREFVRPEILGTLGYRPISPRQGWHSLLTCLRCAPGHYYVGLDGSHRRIRRYSGGSNAGVQQLTAFVSGQLETSAAPALGVAAFRDRFGAEGTHRIRVLPRLPRSARGEVDRAALIGGTRRGRSETFNVAPATDLERKIASIWQQVLAVDQVGVEESFLELGGQSLLATRVIARIRVVFQVELSLRAVFEAATVRGLAAIVQDAQRREERGSAELDAVVALIDGLSDDEVRAALARQRPRREGVAE